MKSYFTDMSLEQSVIGGLMLPTGNGRPSDAAFDALETVTSGDFANHAHGLIFSAMQGMLERGSSIDMITVADELARRNQLDEVGGFGYLAEVSKNTPSAANLSEYVRRLRDNSLGRRMQSELLLASQVLVARDGRAMTEKVGDVQGRISAVESVQAGGAVSILDCLEEVVADLESSFRGDDNENAITLGLPDIDQALGGINPTDMIVVGGRPSHGKTTVLTTICEHMSVHQNYPVLIFSLEMSRKQLTERMMFHLAKARRRDVLGQTQMNSDEAWGRISNAVGALTSSAIMIDDRGRMTINDIRAEARRVAKKYGKLRAIMIDYIQLIDTSGAPTQLQGVSDISKGIKRLCKELETPVIALSQLSRDVEKRVNKRPVNSDLRESGQIEQDADLIFMVYNEEKYDPLTPQKGITELICTKSRHVPGAEKAYRFVNTYGGLDPLHGSFAMQSRGIAQELEL